MSGKGSKQRPTDKKAFDRNFDAIFGKAIVLEPASTMYKELMTPVDAGDCKLITGEIGTVDCGITFWPSSIISTPEYKAAQQAETRRLRELIDRMPANNNQQGRK